MTKTIRKSKVTKELVKTHSKNDTQTIKAHSKLNAMKFLEIPIKLSPGKHPVYSDNNV